MLKNYFKVAWRSIQKNKGYTLLNIAGLAFGLAVFIVALVYLNHENSYDKWDKQLSRVYRVATTQTRNAGPVSTTWTSYPLGTQMRETCPEIKAVTRIIEEGESLVAAGEKQLYENRIMEADSSFFSVFPYKFIYGSTATALKQPRQAVISVAESRKLFGDENPVGKTLKINNDIVYTVAGVYEFTGPSHLDFNVCLSHFDRAPQNWARQIFYTYVLLRPDASLAALAGKAKKLLVNGQASYFYANKYYENANAGAPGSKPENWLKTNAQVSINNVLFENVADIHLRPRASSWRDTEVNHPLINSKPGNDTPVIFFSVAAILVLLLACINYTNLAIARAGKRAKEAGVRKVMGAAKSQLVKQFMTEALLQNIAALLFALLLAKWVIYLLNNAFSMQLTLFNSSSAGQNSWLTIQLCLVAGLVTLFSGAYPAFVLSSLKPVNVLKGEVIKNVKGSLLRNGLIVLQFGISACFIIGMMVVYRQLNYLNKKDPGFNTEQVLVLKPNNDAIISPGRKEQKLDLIKNQLLQLPGVEAAALTDFYPGEPSMGQQEATYNGRSSQMTFDYIHFDYFKTLNMKLVSGRDFSGEYSADTVNSAIINETAARYMGYTNPIGQKVSIMLRDYNIIGIAKDNHVAGYNSTIQPEIYAIGAKPGLLGGYRAILVKTDGRNAASTSKAIADYWKTVEPAYPLRYSWLDQDFAKLLEKYERFGKITILLSAVSIVIALMGIFALSAFAAAQRTREIGIRKVFGASVAGITAMLSKDFLKLIILSLIVAFPLAYWASYKWLQEFAYRVNQSWLMFAFAGGAIVLMALLTVSFQAVKAAVVNPVKSLRTE